MRMIYSNTSSDGNCSVIEGAKGDMIIIDCGIKFDIVNKAVDYALYKTNAMLLSHSHS